MPKKLTQEEAISKNPKNGPWLIGIYKSCNTRTAFKCCCGEIFYTRPDVIWNGATKGCKKCGNKKISIQHWKGTRDISGHYFCVITHNAKKRNIEFNITKEYAQHLLEKQNYKCALTGLDICGSRNTKKKCSTYKEQTASLDRIDNTKGYIDGNLQWIHKHINWIKQDFTEEQLLEYCRLLIKHHENKICEYEI